MTAKADCRIGTIVSCRVSAAPRVTERIYGIVENEDEAGFTIKTETGLILFRTKADITASISYEDQVDLLDRMESKVQEWQASGQLTAQYATEICEVLECEKLPLDLPPDELLVDFLHDMAQDLQGDFDEILRLARWLLFGSNRVERTHLRRVE